MHSSGNPTFSLNRNIKEIDYDSDTLLDSEEMHLGTDAYNSDTDGDGVNDAVEVKVVGSDPLDASTEADSLVTETQTLTDSKTITETSTVSNFQEETTLTASGEDTDEGFLTSIPFSYWLVPVLAAVVVRNRKLK